MDHGPELDGVRGDGEDVGEHADDVAGQTVPVHDVRVRGFEAEVLQVGRTVVRQENLLLVPQTQPLLLLVFVLVNLERKQDHLW